MSTVTSSTNANFAALNGTGTTKSDTTAEAADRFLKLLVTQMQNQDPLNPLQNSEVTSQLAQINTVVGDLDGNRERILDRLNEARAAGADLVLFPELAVTGYPPEDLLLRPGFLRAAARSLGQIAAEARGIPWTRLNNDSLIQFGYGKNRRLIQAAMTSETPAIAVDTASDKALTKALLERAAIPTAAGEVVGTAEEVLLRGVLVDVLLPHCAPVLVVAVSAVAFGLMHVPLYGWDVLVLDTIGELASVFQYATVVFMGGSLVPRGGHNVLEPAMHRKPVVFGPHMENFREIARLFLEAKAAVQIQSAAELAPAITDLLLNASKASELGRNAHHIVQQNSGATDRVLRFLQPVEARR